MDKAIAIPNCYRQKIGDLLVKRKTTRITVTKEEFWVLHKPKGSLQLRCEECAGEAEMVLAAQAATLAQVSLRELFRAVENQRLHFKETSDGNLFICLDSLGRFVNDKNRRLSGNET